jgi:hypothetical protein
MWFGSGQAFIAIRDELRRHSDDHAGVRPKGQAQAGISKHK